MTDFENGPTSETGGIFDRETVMFCWKARNCINELA